MEFEDILQTLQQGAQIKASSSRAPSTTGSITFTSSEASGFWRLGRIRFRYGTSERG